MTHLYIEQNTGQTEEVNASIISKLYELASSGDLDNTSDLKGRLHSSTGRDVHINYLNNNFSDLYVSADDVYITFADPEVDRVLSTFWGDGNGVTAAQMATHTNLGFSSTDLVTGKRPFLDNTNITSFNELGNFPSIKKIGNDQTFCGATNLTSIDLSNMEEIGFQAFRGAGITGVLNLPSLVKLVDRNIFTECVNITEVNFGPNFISLGSNCQFEQCTNLNKVTGLSNITSMPKYLFRNCSSLTSVDFDWSKITSIGETAFGGCSSLVLNNLSIPNLESLGPYCFSNTKITSVNNLGSITEIPNYCFRGCTDLTSVTLPQTFTGFLGIGAFNGCTSLTTINNLGNSISIEKTGEYIFNGCSNLVFPQTLTITSQVPLTNNMNDNWLREAFQGCNIHEIILDSSVKGISRLAFKNSTLTTLTAPGVKYLGQECFMNCLIAEVNLPSVIGHIASSGNNPYNYFTDCPNLTKVVLGKWNMLQGYVTDSDRDRGWFRGTTTNLNTFDVGDVITEIRINKRSGVFANSSSLLQKFIIRNTTVPTLTKTQSPNTEYTEQEIINCFGGSQVKIYVPDSAVNDYKTANIWSQIASYIYPLSDIEPTT